MKIYCIGHNELEEVSEEDLKEYERKFKEELPSAILYPYMCTRYKKPVKEGPCRDRLIVSGRVIPLRDFNGYECELPRGHAGWHRETGTIMEDYMKRNYTVEWD